MIFCCYFFILEFFVSLQFLMLFYNFLQISNIEILCVFVCIFCQQWKICCDCIFFCVNCYKVNVRCVLVMQICQWCKCFFECELLDCFCGYEVLLWQNNIKFELLYSVDGLVDRLDYRSSNGDIELKDGNLGVILWDGFFLELEKVVEVRYVWMYI